MFGSLSSPECCGMTAKTCMQKSLCIFSMMKKSFASTIISISQTFGGFEIIWIVFHIFL